MRRKMSLLFILLLLLSSFSVHASTLRSSNIIPSLTFVGQTANCKVIVNADNNDDISIVVKLWEGTRCIKTWTSNDTGNLSFSKTISVTAGKAYKLTVDAIIAGVAQPTYSDVGICGY